MLTITDTQSATKAQTLAALRNLLVQLDDDTLAQADFGTEVLVLDQRHFTVAAWQADKAGILTDVLSAFPSQHLIVRSSAVGEDGSENSHAGAFDSVANVAPDEAMLSEAIQKVIESYGLQTSYESEVLVQPMAENIAVSGVIFSREINTGADYFAVNYDDFSGRTDTVTGGKSSKVLYIRRGHSESIHSDRLFNLTKLTIFLEKATDCPSLDIEWGIDTAGRIYVFQVRPLTMARNWDEELHLPFNSIVDQAFEQIQSRWDSTEPDLFGSRPALSDMADWNPAEILGDLPTPLSSSLYREIITRRCWAEARAEMGYRDLTSHDLMVDVCGKQYIDIRLSLNSFLPADTDPGFARELIEYQLDKVTAERHLHDKLEFEVAITCTDFASHKRFREFIDEGFDPEKVNAFADTVLALTRQYLEAGVTGMENTAARQKSITVGDKAQMGLLDISTLDQHLSELAEFGTLPFAILARHGFIGVSYLRSMVSEGMISAERADQFMRNVETITAAFIDDLSELTAGSLSQDDFLRQYGHLRPGTYDIESLRYDEAPEFYLSHAARALHSREKFSLTEKERASIAAGLQRLDISISPDDLIDYITAAIRLREQSKFDFTRYLSNLLASLKDWGQGMGLDRARMAYANVDDLLDFSKNRLNRKDLEGRIDEAIARHNIHRMVRLPAVIVEPHDVNVVRLPMSKPNFITHQQRVAPSIYSQSLPSEQLDGKIVLIESADPGFDWLFTHSIAGLVTKYGGSNSHMAIRCAEFGIPAAIGCGDRLFEELKTSKLIELNCTGQLVRSIR